MNSQRHPSPELTASRQPVLKSFNQVKNYLASHPNENRRTVGVFYKNNEVKEYSRKDGNRLGANTFSQYKTKLMSLGQKYESFQPSVGSRCESVDHHED